MFNMNNQSKTAHLLIDKQNMEIIHHDQITPEERQHRNSAAEKVGEIFLVWLPVVFSDLYNAADNWLAKSLPEITRRLFQSS